VGGRSQPPGQELPPLPPRRHQGEDNGGNQERKPASMGNFDDIGPEKGEIDAEKTRQ
jgi:hypothetical protein